MGSRLSGLLAASVGIVALAAGCSSTPSATCPPGDVCTPIGDGGLFRRFSDAATDSGASTLVADGTSGKACTKNADCVGAGGIGVNKCSSTLGQFKFTNVGYAEWASPICVVPPTATGTCDPAPIGDPMGQLIHYCDGPDDMSAPGLCLPLTTPPQAGQGFCLPKCTFPADGSPATGCVGHNTCAAFSFTIAQGALIGIGLCEGVCQSKADCADLGPNYECQVDIGKCTLATVPRTKSLGQVCSTAGTTNDQTTGACNCLTGPGTSGFCSSTCVAGGNACPNGWVCDTGELANVNFGPGAPTFPTLKKQTTGMPGYCVPGCTAGDAGTAPGGQGVGAEAGPLEASAGGTFEAGASEAGGSEAGPQGPVLGACPANVTCQTSTIVSPDCLP